MRQITKFSPNVLVENMSLASKIWYFSVCWAARLSLLTNNRLLVIYKILVSAVETFSNHLWRCRLWDIFIFWLGESSHELLLLKSFRSLSFSRFQGYSFFPHIWFVSKVLFVFKNFLEILNHQRILVDMRVILCVRPDKFFAKKRSRGGRSFSKIDLTSWNWRYRIRLNNIRPFLVCLCKIDLLLTSAIWSCEIGF